MFGSGVPIAANGRPNGSELAKVAGLAATLAAVLAALATFGEAGDQGVREYVVVLALIVVVTLGVFAWAVPSAMELDEPGPSAIALALSGLGLLTLLLFWSGLPLILASGGIVLGRTQRDVPEDRHLALAAIGMGAAAIVLCVLFYIADLS